MPHLQLMIPPSPYIFIIMKYLPTNIRDRYILIETISS